MSNEKILKKLHEQFDERFEKIIKSMKKYSKKSNLEMIRHAYNFGLDAHKKQRRYSGEPYFDHCMNVAEILADLKMDSTTITAGILHDVVEDTDFNIDDIKNMFGDKVAEIVDGLTKLSGDFDSRQALTLKKMLMTLV